MTWDQYSQETFYDVYPVEYQLSNGKISVKQIDEEKDSGIPIYRRIEEKTNYVRDGANILEGKGIYFKHVGYFEVDEDQHALAASPLGIYGIHPTYLAKNKDLQVHPTALPGSFITTPAHGLISIKWAERLKGEAPIDAIRVRVAGIDGYDQAAAEKIKKMAAEFEQQGYTVDIVAGASHQWLTIDVENLGDVVQPWTTLGAADSILQSWDIVKISLVISFTLVCLVYLLFSCLEWLQSRRRDEKLLRSFGWDKIHILQLRIKESAYIVGIPCVIAIFAILIIGLYTSQFILLLYLVIILIVICLIMILVNLYYDFHKRKESRPLRVGPVIWQNVWYYRNAISFSSTQLVVLTVVTLLLPLITKLEEQRTIQTTLGIYVHGKMEWFYSMLLVTLYTLALLTFLETLISLWKKRSREIVFFQHIGWGNEHIFKLYLKEVLIWTATSVLIGLIMSVIGYHLLFENIGEVFG